VKYKLSNKAEEDLREVYRYPRLKFGDVQADAYFTGLDESLCLLAENISMAQKVDDLRAGYHRYYYQKHAVYFVEKKKYILVIRVLHRQMKPQLHL